MNEKINEIIEETKMGMEDVIDFFSKTLQKYHAGKATPDMLDGVKVDCYGSKMPINQVGNINIPDAKQIIVQPWDKSMLGPIEKAIQNANLGFNPINNGEVLRIIVPALTEERRKDMVKKIRQEAETAKVSIRSVRKTANNSSKDLKSNGVSEDEVKVLDTKIQDMTNDFTAKVDKMLAVKEEEIMTV